MPKGLRLLSLLLLATSTHAAVDNQIIKSEAASAIALAGRIGEAAMFSVQTDEDTDLEIFATASSKIDTENDHWLLLDWDGTDYQIVKTGTLQAENHTYLSSIQISDSKLLLGQMNGKLTTIEFTDDVNSTDHTLSDTHVLLNELNHQVDEQIDINTDIKSIVTHTGTDQIDYTVLCTANLIHVLNNDILESTLDEGGHCQSGNIDYAEVTDGIFDQELITQNGLYFNFDGVTWTEKEGLSSSNFGDNFLVANIDDDAAQEILSQSQSEQIQSFAPTSLGSWVYIHPIQEAKQNFNVIDIDGDGVVEILFDYIYTDEAPHSAEIVKVSWDTNKDSHIYDGFITSPYLKVSTFKRLATTLIDGTYGDHFIFTSNGDTANPNSNILHRIEEVNFSIDWSGIYSTSTRSFDGIARTQDGDTILDYKLVLLEQIDLGDNNYRFSYKFLDATNLLINSIVEPDFTDDEMITVDSFSIYDFDQDGVDELHAGGKSVYEDQQGTILSSKLDGTDFDKLITPFIESVTAFFVGNANLTLTTDIVATGKNTSEDGGIGILIRNDGISNNPTWYKPGSGDTDFKKLVASNIKGGAELELLGLESQLVTYNPNAAFGESIVYSLSNLDLDQFTPIKLENRDYEYALASDTAGMLHLIEPLDFDILASIKACDTELSTISNVRINNKLDVAIAICGQQLLSWVVEYNPNIQEYGYSLHALSSYPLGDADTSTVNLVTIETDELNNGEWETHLFALLKNKFHRFLINKDLGIDGDTDGVLNYRDVFPSDDTQWTDSDHDGFGDNLAPANNPDPSLNDIDNDGVLDDVDPDNNPENDLNPLNDVDNGPPSFTNTPLPLVKVEFDSALTSVTFPAPTATDLFDDLAGNGTPTISASSLGNALTEVTADEFEANLITGMHTINWQAQDVEGNSTSTSQEAWVYPNIAFDASTQRLGETQTANIKLVLSGTSPEYPFTVNLNINGSSVQTTDVTEDINNLSVIFNDGETEKTLTLNFIDDSIIEDDETLIITITDDFNSSPTDASWTVDSQNSIHTITIVDVNAAPTFVNSSVSQNGNQTTSPNNVDGSITLTANFSDSNSLIYLWDLSSLNFPNALMQSASFDPSGLEPGVYSLNVTATDNGLPSKSFQQMVQLIIYYGDTDKDTYNDDVDAFPQDPAEHSDRDGDGVGDNADVFPDNKDETLDFDGDNVGNNTDPFDDDASEWADADNDGHGDNIDLFDDNADEWQDSDGDGVGDNADPFDDDASEWADADNDGHGDNIDLFDDNADEWQDSDGDGVGDNSDDFINDATRSKKLSDQSLEDDGAGSINYLFMLLLASLIWSRRRP